MLLIPSLHYLGAALATFSCYLFMMVVSYKMGQKYYPIPYAKKKLIAYLVIVSLLYGLHRGLLLIFDNLWFSIITASLLLLVFTWFIGLVEQKELRQMPLIGRFYKKPRPVIAS
jgi:O-antigen/teichoic acid export membrane protein